MKLWILNKIAQIKSYPTKVPETQTLKSTALKETLQLWKYSACIEIKVWTDEEKKESKYGTTLTVKENATLVINV